MTLCIAAHCHEAGAYRIALCFDRKGTSGSGSSETIHKYEHIGGQLRALLAGTVSEARELADIYRQHFSSGPLPSANLSTLLEEMRKPAALYRSRKISAHIGEHFGMTLEEFLSSPLGSTLPSELSSIRCEAELILAGFIEDKPVIFQYGNWGVTVCDNHATIGEGSYVAAPLLLYRNQADYDTLSSTLYKIYEAKKLAEVYDSVGSQTNIMVLTPDLQNQERIHEATVSPDGLAFMQKRFDELGPKPLGLMFDFPVGELNWIG
jgi:20S proteasome alpha/beta subunit